MEPKRAFLFLSIVFGVPLALVSAPFQAPDEPNHFLRAYQISEGTLVSEYRENRGGGEVPVSLENVIVMFQGLRAHSREQTSWPEVKSALQIPLEPGIRSFRPFPMAVYSPLVYVPQATAILVGRTAGLGPLQLMYLGRLANLLTWIGLSYGAMTMAPALARPLLLLQLMPVSLFQAASLSGDAMTNGLAVLFVATVWRHAVGDRGCESQPSIPQPTIPIRFADLVILLLLASAVSLAKFAYWPLSALVLLIPAQRFGGHLRRAVAAGAIALAGLAAVLTWAPHTHGFDAIILDRPYVDAHRQLEFLQSHPSRIFSIALHTFLGRGLFILKTFSGQLGSVRLSPLFTVPYAVAQILACATVTGVTTPSIKRVILIVVVPVSLSVAMIAFLNYVFWSPVGEEHVEGMQGRHLIPLAPAVIVLLTVLLCQPARLKRVALHSEWLNRAAAVFALASCGYSVTAVFVHFYVS